MCKTRAVFCRNRGCRKIVGELILKPCEEATKPTDSSTRITTQTHDTSSSSACGSEKAETNGVEEWLAEARPYLFGCGYKEYTERHRCGYRVCDSCFQRQMMTYIPGLAINGIESEEGEPSLLARRQHLSLQAGKPQYGDLGEECQTPREVCAQDPTWSPGYPAMLNESMVKVEDPELLVNSAPVVYRATPGMMDDIYDGPFIDGGQFQPAPAQMQQQVLYPGQAEPYLYQDPGPSFQPIGLEDPGMFAIDPQLLDWQREPQLSDFLMQPASAPFEAAPTGDPSSCAEDVKDTANADILNWEASVEAQAGGYDPAFTHWLEEAVSGGDVGSHVWNQDVVWGASGYYS
ncbi:unnamed protein product [Clonostachys chloroleuca]|uniref:Uncharacterized protein n=1 Tax=Clonostachys chloroleuca TaxID=1926264 RepID=A0AA35Q4N9_9HYPO|nr:unnamed protein product [Clonostachys chloroleuca]